MNNNNSVTVSRSAQTSCIMSEISVLLLFTFLKF